MKICAQSSPSCNLGAPLQSLRGLGMSSTTQSMYNSRSRTWGALCCFCFPVVFLLLLFTFFFFFEDFFFFYRSRKIGERIFLHVFISYLVSFTGTVLTKLCRVPLFNTVCHLSNAEAALNINGSIKDFWKYMVEII